MVSDQDHLDGDQLSTPALFGGIDWGGSFHQLCVLDGQGTVLLQQRVIHDVAGLALLADRLEQFGAHVLVAIERAEGLLVEFLQTLPSVTLFCVSPKLSARPGNGIGCRRRSRTRSTPSSWPTHCATNTAAGGR